MLGVTDKPIYSGVPGSITLKEGEGGVYNFSAISNPAVTKYTWFKVIPRFIAISYSS